MKNNMKDSTGIRIPPPLYFIFCIGLGLLLEYLFPNKYTGFALIPRIIIGCMILFISTCFAVSGFFVLIRNKTPFDTAQSTSKIVTEGPFRFSSNPLYLSLMLLLSGSAFLFFSLWLFLLIPVLYLLFLYKAVKPEEIYLSQKFGEEYLNYTRKVRRWI